MAIDIPPQVVEEPGDRVPEGPESGDLVRPKWAPSIEVINELEKLGVRLVSRDEAEAGMFELYHTETNLQSTRRWENALEAVSQFVREKGDREEVVIVVYRNGKELQIWKQVVKSVT